jgi:uracil-DNA glycosylase
VTAAASSGPSNGVGDANEASDQGVSLTIATPQSALPARPLSWGTVSRSVSLTEVAETVVGCSRCPRLVAYRQAVPPRRAFESERYWRKPIPGFGDPEARLVIIGLAPAAHGGNRTGRVFTGDESGRFLVRALFEAGYASQPVSSARGDGLVYTDCYITAAVKCAPPGDKPTREEFEDCSVYLASELRLLRKATAVMALGRAAFGAYLGYAGATRGAATKGLEFAHGRRYELDGLPTLYASYHPSPRNTYTGKLTMEMLVSLLEKIGRDRR